MNQEERGIARTGFVPTAAERAGDFSGPSIAGCTPAIPTDPTTGQPFPGNVIPSDRINAGGQGMLNLYPLPNVTPTGGSCNNWVEAVVTPIDWDQANMRLDYDATDRTRLMLRYTRDNWVNGAPNAGEANGLWGDDPYPAVDTNWDQPGHSLVAQLSQTIGDDSVNTVTFSYSGNEISLNRGGTNPGLNSQINAAIPAIFDGKTGGADRSHPVFWGAAGYGALWNIAPWENKQDLMVLKDDYSQVFGKHWLKVGALYSENKKKEYIGGSSASETPQFWGPSTGHNGWGANTGNVLADFLLQDMTFGYAENSHQPTPELNWEDVEFYVADSWQANPRLNIDYGVRYSNYKWPYASDDLLTAFDPRTFDPALGGDPCNGLLQVPGTDPCGDAGLMGGSTGPGPRIGGQRHGQLRAAPRPGLRPLRQRPERGPGRLRPVLPARPGEHPARVRGQPALPLQPERHPQAGRSAAAVPRLRPRKTADGHRPELPDAVQPAVQRGLGAATRPEQHDRDRLRRHPRAPHHAALRHQPGGLGRQQRQRHPGPARVRHRPGG